MKRMAVAAVWGAMVFGSAGCGAVIRVDTAEGLLDAIGSDRVIELAPGDYALSDQKDRRMDFVRWDPEFDGKSITIRNVRNLTIAGRPDAPARLLVRPRYVYVLNFENCENVVLENLVLGHSPEGGYCSCGVVGVSGSRNVTLRRCELFGSGTEGLTLRKVRGFSFEDSVIRDCTYGIMTIEACADLRFSRSSFIRNKEYWGVNITDSMDIAFSGCRFAQNEAPESPLFAVSSSANVTVTDCEMADNKVTSESP